MFALLTRRKIDVVAAIIGFISVQPTYFYLSLIPGMSFTIVFGKVMMRLRACLHGGGVPQIGEVTRLGGVTRLSI